MSLTFSTSLEPAARRDLPHDLDPIVVNAHEAIVKIDGTADVVGDDRDAITYAKASGIFSEPEHAMLLP